ALFRECIADIAGSDRSKQLVLFACAAGKGNGESVELFRQFFGLRFFFGRAPQGGGAHLLDHLPVSGGRLNGELAGQQEIAAVSFGYFHYVAASAKLRDIFFQNDFHWVSPIKFDRHDSPRTSRGGASIPVSLSRGWES